VCRARRWNEFSVESHQRAHEATEKGYFKTQLLPVDISLDGNGHHDFFERDEGIRANASYEATSALQPAFNRSTRSPPATRARSQTARRPCF